MLNKVILAGRFVANPEIRTTTSGLSVATFRLAVERNYAAQGQERGCDFIRCVAWGKQGEFIATHFTKGTMITIEGSLQSRNYVDRDNQKRQVTEVNVAGAYFCGSSPSGAGNYQKNSNSQQGFVNNTQKDWNPQQPQKEAPNPAGQSILNSAESFGISLTPWEETSSEDLPF